MKRGDLLHFLGERDKDAKDGAAAATNDPGKRRPSDAFTPVTERELWIIFRQVVHGMKYLHQHKIIHGDIKPQNLLMGEDGVLRIADFGISKMLTDGQKLENVSGTPAFMSPELCAGATSLTLEQLQLADVWAIAATMFMLRCGHPPFLAGSIINLYNKIINDPLVFPFAIDPSLQDLLTHMLEKDPAKRYTLQEVIQHPWLRQPPTNFTRPGTSSSAAPSRRGNFGVWPPAPTYDKDERAAMDSPIKTADNEDVFMSIMQNTKTEAVEEAEHEEMMNTNWGIDVFDKVDDVNFNSGSEDEKSDDDDEPIKPVAATKSKFNGGNRAQELAADQQAARAEPAAAKTSSKTFDSAPSEKAGAEDAKGESKSSGPLIEREAMKATDEELRAQRFRESLASKAKPAPAVAAASAPGADSDSDDDYSVASGGTHSHTAPAPAKASRLPAELVSKSDGHPAPARAGMDETEEQKRAMRFQKLNKTKKNKLDRSEGSDSDSSDLSEKKNPATTHPAAAKGSSIYDTYVDPRSAGTAAPNSENTAPLARMTRPANIRVDSEEIDDDDRDGASLTMDDFSKLMDTLSAPPVQALQADTPVAQSPMVLGSVKVIEMQRNSENGVGTAVYSAQGVRPHQEDRYTILSNLPSYAEVALHAQDSNRARRERNSWSKEEYEALRVSSILGIFDGHSGHMCADFVNEMLIPSVLFHEDFFTKKIGPVLSDVFRKIDEEVCASNIFLQGKCVNRCCFKRCAATCEAKRTIRDLPGWLLIMMEGFCYYSLVLSA